MNYEYYNISLTTPHYIFVFFSTIQTTE